LFEDLHQKNKYKLSDQLFFTAGLHDPYFQLKLLKNIDEHQKYSDIMGLSALFFLPFY
jgi:hypothetical protein